MRKSNNPIDEELLMKKFKEYEGNQTIALRNEIIEMNVPLVDYIVKKYLSDIGVDIKELVSIGNFGLIKAVETYNMDYGTRFSIYATTCILNKIKNDLRNVIGMKNIQYFYPILKAKNIIERTTGIKLEDNISELDSILEEDIFVTNEMKEKLKDYLLYRDCKYNEHNVTGSNEIEDTSIEKVLIEEMQKELDNLPENEREVLRHRYGFYGSVHTLDDIGKYMGCSHQNISSTEKKALKKIRKKMECIF